VPWRETPELILELVGNFEPPPERNPQKKGFVEIKPPGIRGWILKVFYNRTRQFYLLREQYSSLYTYTLMLFRVYYLALGDWMVARGLLDANEDVYYLYDEEIRKYIEGKEKGTTFKTLVQKRKEEIEHCRDAITPEIIYGDKPPPVIVHQDRKLSGTPTSRGYYTGNTKLVCGISDFQKVDKGDVLVIPHSDVGWVPLFAKAGAVVAESGGILSHSSIVAREYGIPAVVSVNGALNLRDNLVVSVDGYKGEVFVHDQE
jgi:pyruvate,water dikinase